ncbi:efflux RND transporter periplasmic adaptor subunit [Thiomicrorhabdus cannonii]|uniref:efflux RND transporter periplasmic adaptor subunit n=1 Tax=Thiomicrorhabdus cannonii TaxID=2748011 RepID=UPI001FE78EE8|nr:efflux RND transporter periplasmic adaptor subunit [Thiomicrorhabdus cannonii]
MTMLLRHFLTAIAFGPLLTFVTTAHAAEESAAKAKTALPIIAFETQTVSQPQQIRALGTLQASQSIQIAANVTDKIQAIHFTDGQWVNKSQLLLELNSAEELARLEQAKAQTEEAWLQYQRVKNVVGRGSVTQAQVDEKYREWQTATAQRKVYEAQVADRRLYAPFDGELGLSQVAVGALVTAGEQIVSLDDTRSMKLDLLVPVKYLANLSRGQNVNLTTSAYPNRVFQGQIQAISPRIEQNVRMVQVRALVANPDHLLKTNMLVEATLQLPPQVQLQIPNSALLMIGDREFVYRLQAKNDGKDDSYITEKVEVKSGQIGSAMTEITQGLNAGDLVVSQGVMRLKPKMAVRIKAMENGHNQEELLKPVKKPAEKTQQAGSNNSNSKQEP